MEGGYSIDISLGYNSVMTLTTKFLSFVWLLGEAMIMATPEVSTVWIKKARKIGKMLELKSKNLLTDLISE